MTRWLVAVGVSGALAATALHGQTMEVRPIRNGATVGDPVTFRITVKLGPGMELLDATPHLLVPPPRGTRFLSADTLRPAGGGEFTGTARMAFFRTGQQPVPTLALLYRRTPGGPLDTLLHMPVSVEIASILSGGNPTLKDIKPLIPLGGPPWLPLLIVLLAVAGGTWWLWRRSRTRRADRELAPTPVVLGAFDAALARLAQMEAVARQSGNGVLPVYAGVAEVIRTCLSDLGALPEPGLTTPEVSASLPEALATPELRQRFEVILRDADLVKFAKVRPDFAAALEQLTRGRSLLEAWRERSQPDGEKA